MIYPGDKVNVYFENCPCIFNAQVVYVPCQPDDSYILIDEKEAIIVVKNFAYIKKIQGE